MKPPASRLALALLAVLALAARPARACGPDLPVAEFLALDSPEAGQDAYLGGRIGYVSPRFPTFDLVVAYRHLAGIGVSPAARAAFVGAAPAAATTGYADWRKAREATGVELADRQRWMPTSRSLVRGDAWLYFENCQDDAFRAATRTLADRMAREGGLTAPVKNWLAGQDSVFANCGGDSGLVAPPPAPSGAPAWLVHDRAYQSAAARFYAADYAGAAREFGRIAGDASSPWSHLAAYLVARARTRQGTLVAAGADGPFDARELARAREQVDRILADPRLADVHEAARRLRSFLDFRLERSASLVRLSRDLSADTPGPGAPGEAVDLAKLLRWYTPELVESLAAGAPELDLADWLTAMRSARGEHALARYRQGRAEPWLVAALLAARGADPATPELMIAASQVREASAAYETVTLERLRLHMERGEAPYARQLLDACLAGGHAWSRTALNLMHGMRGLLATSLGEFVRDAPRVPVRIAGAFDGRGEGMLADESPAPLLDRDGAALLSDRMPVRAMADLAADARLPAPIRARLALAAWTRATILGQDSVVARVTPAFAALWPELDSSLAVWGGAKTREARRFESAWFVLTHPGCRPDADPGVGRATPIGERDMLRDNLWCTAAAVAPRDASPLPELAGLGWTGDWPRALNDLETRVLPAAERARAAREREAWRRAGPGINWACGIVLAEVRRNPRDPRLPEALHRCVLLTRMSCGDAKTSEWSRRAFRALHANYPASDWARRTKYWY